jgi:hypothetical protein
MKSAALAYALFDLERRDALNREHAKRAARRARRSRSRSNRAEESS